jgi:helicase
VPGAVADIAREAGANLLRGDYCALAKLGLGEPSAVAAADEATLLAVVAEDRNKLSIVRAAAEHVAIRRAAATKASTPVLDAYTP